MALDTYQDLQDYVLAMLDRADDPDAQAQVVNWIKLAENELRLAANRLKLREGETLNQSFSIGTEFTSLPADYIGFRLCTIQSSPNVELEYIPPTVTDRWTLLDGQTGTPKIITLQGNKLRVKPAPDTVYTAWLTYYALPALSATNTTNWLYTAHPKIYVRATMAEAYDYYENEEKRQAMEADRERMFNAAYTADSSDWQGGPLQGYVRSAP